MTTQETRLDAAMGAMGISAVALSAEAGLSASLISRYQKGLRPLSPKSDAARQLAGALARLDTGGALDELLAPWRVAPASFSAPSGGAIFPEPEKREALGLYLTGQPMPGLPAEAALTPVPHSGEYVGSFRVLLGSRGFQKAALVILDYLRTLPPGQSLTVCVHGGYELWHGSLPFAAQFLQKLAAVARRDARLTLVSRDAEGLDGSPEFAVYWLVVQLKGLLRNCIYDGPAPGAYFTAVIPGHLGATAEADDTAEDGLVTTLYTDPRGIRRHEALCAEYVRQSVPAGQFGFFRHPAWNGGRKQAWQAGGPAKAGTLPGPGGFSFVCQLPGFGVATQKEWRALCGKEPPPPLPEWLFSADGVFENAPHRLALCREEVQAGLAQSRRLHGPFSEILGRKVYLPREMLAAQLGRMVDAMGKNPDFEVALVPRSAFQKLELELVHWPAGAAGQAGAALGWLQNGGESLLATDAPTCTSYANAAEQIWSKLQKGWKRPKTVKATLRKWLKGKGLE